MGVQTAQHRVEWPELVARVRLAEEAGTDGAWIFATPSLLAAEADTVDHVLPKLTAS